MEPSATSTAVNGPVEERLQAGTEDAHVMVLDRPAPLRRLLDSYLLLLWQTVSKGTAATGEARCQWLYIVCDDNGSIMY